MRVLVVTNLYPSEESPRRGRFVRDQVEAMRELGAEVETFTFPLRGLSYTRAVRPLREKLAAGGYDVVHAHFGLCGWTAARAGASPLVVTFHGTDVRHGLSARVSRRLAGRLDLVAGASASVFEEEGGRRGLPAPQGRTVVLPCGVDLTRFAAIARAEARRRLGLPDGRYLLFPADPDRHVKRADRAAEVARLARAELITGGEIDPERMPDYVNAVSAVLITSESEGFGLAALEALACRVPVLSTPVGVVPLAAGAVDGCLVAPFDAERWAEAARPLLERDEARTGENWAVTAFSAKRMAARVLAAYEDLIEA